MPVRAKNCRRVCCCEVLTTLECVAVTNTGNLTAPPRCCNGTSSLCAKENLREFGPIVEVCRAKCLCSFSRGLNLRIAGRRGCLGFIVLW